MKTFESPTRVWINQPSKLQPNHQYHGMVGIALTDREFKNHTIVYFATGHMHSTIIQNGMGLETTNSHTNVFKDPDFKN